eukprot:TRINITY_DN51224_c0_g1_i1.p1 TRINITY_DN51224_c0_g1~~TRINITY_DN51224_c0_g1_i1.p1  ORF type:complete len:861 (-),score=73.71 TRINITY_DN51224_c0_g1_i1:44-2626(-)
MAVASVCIQALPQAMCRRPSAVASLSLILAVLSEVVAVHGLGKTSQPSAIRLTTDPEDGQLSLSHQRTKQRRRGMMRREGLPSASRAQMRVDDAAAVTAESSAALLERRRERDVQTELGQTVTAEQTAIPEMLLERPRVSCGANQTSMGNQASLSACAHAVREVNGTFFLYGSMNKSGDCLHVRTSSSQCPEGFEADERYDFYSVATMERPDSCARPQDFCRGNTSVYQDLDCDRDGIPDPYCVGPDIGNSSYLSSSKSCQEVVTGCDARFLKNRNGGKCLMYFGAGRFTFIPCKEGRKKQHWYFAGDRLRVFGDDGCLAEEMAAADGAPGRGIIMQPCAEGANSRWYFDAHSRLRNRWGSRCATNSPVTSTLTMQTCTLSDNQKFYFSPARDCMWSSWSEFSGCSATCGGGTAVRHRFVTAEAEHGGAKCEGKSSEELACQAAVACPVDCRYSSWAEWSACSESCSSMKHLTGSKQRRRIISRTAAGGGQECAEPLTQTATCQGTPCPVDCKFGAWTKFSPCSHRCGGGVRTRSRRVSVFAMAGGKVCPGRHGRNETVPCNMHVCPIDCQWSAWTTWAGCAGSCGGGTMTRTRHIRQESLNGGRACHGDSFVRQNCVTEPCPTACKWEDWNDWTQCPVSCGVGVGLMIRSRGKAPEAHGGTPCQGPDQQHDNCNNYECPVDCAYREWEEWSTCRREAKADKPGCYKHRNRFVGQQPFFGGRSCLGAVKQLASCKHCHDETASTEVLEGGTEGKRALLSAVVAADLGREEVGVGVASLEQAASSVFPVNWGSLLTGALVAILLGVALVVAAYVYFCSGGSSIGDGWAMPTSLNFAAWLRSANQQAQEPKLSVAAERADAN